ncbi:MAG: hypothetical protein M1816_003075 [Peltula sp. TS41687]|nr:MAG: hypothetical protein M1816_003075 [Peltula sp. TS41687]
MTTSPLALAFLATIATAIPAGVSSSDSLSVASPSMSKINGGTALFSGVQSYQITYSDHRPPDLGLGFGPKGTDFRSNVTDEHRLVKRWVSCDEDVSYVTGAVNWIYWSRNLCRSLFNEAAEKNSANQYEVTGWITLKVSLSDSNAGYIAGQNDLNFAISKAAPASAVIKINQQERRKGFPRHH